MLSWIVLILCLAACFVLGMWLSAKIFGRGEALPPMPETEDVKEANRRAVEDGNFGEIQLEVVHRGYRMDQVDALIAQLTGQEEAATGARNPQRVEAHSLTEGVTLDGFDGETPTTTEAESFAAKPEDRA